MTAIHRDLKVTVRSMKTDAQAKFNEVMDIVENKEFWRKCKELVEHCAPV
jgi:hypothetical protein